MKLKKLVFVVSIVSVVSVAAMVLGSARTEAAAGGNHCARGIKSCSASRIGQPCDPNNLNVICSAQADGSYCCLAYAP